MQRVETWNTERGHLVKLTGGWSIIVWLILQRAEDSFSRRACATFHCFEAYIQPLERFDLNVVLDVMLEIINVTCRQSQW